MNIPFLSFGAMHGAIRSEMVAAFERVYDSHWYILGKSVARFEEAYAKFTGTEHCVGVSNGLDALYLSLKALGVGAGDEVIVPSNGYIATWLSVTFTGATPVPVEPDNRTFNLDPTRIAAAVSPRTRAIIPIHLYGQACDMAGIMAVAEAKGLKVIEDNAQGHAASFQGRLTGAWGHVNATSFYPGKNLGALGDAGAVTTDNAELAAKVRTLRNYGSSKKYYNEVVGHNMRLDELQAELLLVKLAHLGDWTAQRRVIAGWYDAALAGIPGLLLPWTHPEATHAYHLYVVRTDKRDAFQAYLASEGIGTMIHYPVPPHLQEAYRDLGYGPGDFPIAEEMARTCISLPLWPGMTKEMVDAVAAAARAFLSA